jgi:hypothetical protein
MWLALVFVLGADGTFVRSPGTLPLPILFGVTTPIVIFFFLFSIWPAFRECVLSMDLAFKES